MNCSGRKPYSESSGQSRCWLHSAQVTDCKAQTGLKAQASATRCYRCRRWACDCSFLPAGPGSCAWCVMPMLAPFPPGGRQPGGSRVLGMPLSQSTSASSLLLSTLLSKLAAAACLEGLQLSRPGLLKVWSPAPSDTLSVDTQGNTGIGHQVLGLQPRLRC